ncbi:MAG: chorismate mutase [Nanohaloarchaea archaeon]|nr:chorismate mutase [Candidatus Nanohaloarchaea archaeon]
MDLEDYRKEIDRVNTEIVDAVSRRMNVVEEIGEYKKQNGMEIKDEGREEVVKDQFEKLFEKEDLPREKGRELAELLIDTAVDLQEEDM